MSQIKKLLFFKRMTLILILIWSFATTSFLVYQIHNEEKHIVNETIQRAYHTSKQAESLIKWAFDRKAKQQQKARRLEMKTDFSLRNLIYKMSAEQGAQAKVESNYLEDDFVNLDENIIKAIKTMQKEKVDQHAVYSIEDEKYLFYIRPFLADKSCLSCHIHDDKKSGDLLGNFNLKIKIPKFKEYKTDSFVFLVFAYFLTWIAGVFVILWIRHKNKAFFEDKMKNYEDSIFSLVDMMERRDSYTAGHSKRVAQYSSLLAKKLGCSEDDINLVYKAGMLHDLGKIEIPDALLLKPDRLSKDEYELIKTHSKFGYEILSREPFSELSNIVLHHHERYDGRGYPYGLKGDEIPYLSQIIAVADSFDAMTTNRSYRKCFTLQDTLDILDGAKGTQFTPEIVDVALEIFKEVELPEDTTQMPRNILDEMRFSYYFRDQLTNVYNVSYLKFILAHKSSYKKICAHHVNCINFTRYNEKYGWRNGNILLKSIAEKFKEHYKNSIVVRVFGDNFLIVTLGYHEELQKDLLNPITDGYNLEIEYHHMDLIAENIDSVEALEDKILAYHKKK